MSKNVIYYPPSRQKVDQYARAVCKRLAETTDPSFNTPDIVRGLSAFLCVVTLICVHHLNKDNHVNTSKLLDRRGK